MKITIYTITDCPFSKAEKEYLTAKNLQFEEKNLETSKEFLTEMMSVSDNFAGVPFTLITKDDGTELKMKGFTKEDFEKELSVNSVNSVNPVKSADPVTSPVVSTTPPAPYQAPTASPMTPTAMPVPPAPKTDDLSNVMNTLSSMSSTPTVNPIPVATDIASVMPPTASTMSVPDAPSAGITDTTASAAQPQVPDFPQN